MQKIQQKVQKLIDRAVQDGKERGLQIVVYFKGKLIVDAWSGFFDPDKMKAIDGDTLFPVFSTTKGVTATIIHLLAERGKLDYDAKIADYWPEFGGNGKSRITLRQAMNHSAGLPNMPTGVKPIDLCDWDKMCRKIAQLKPVWPPGTRQEYHAITYGWLLGEVARRVDGRSFEAILKEEICRPLQITGLYIGLPKSLHAKVATLDDLNVSPDLLNAPPASPIPGNLTPLHELMNSAEGRLSCVPASSGTMNAGSIARHYAALLPGGIDGVELLPQSRIKIASSKQKLKDGTVLNHGLGYNLGGDLGSIYGPRHSAFGHGGFGGSVGFADPKYKLAIGLTKNLFSEKGMQYHIVCEIRRLLGIPN